MSSSKLEKSTACDFSPIQNGCPITHDATHSQTIDDVAHAGCMTHHTLSNQVSPNNNRTPSNPKYMTESKPVDTKI